MSSYIQIFKSLNPFRSNQKDTIAKANALIERAASSALAS